MKSKHEHIIKLIQEVELFYAQIESLRIWQKYLCKQLVKAQLDDYKSAKLDIQGKVWVAKEFLAWLHSLEDVDNEGNDYVLQLWIEHLKTKQL